MRISISEPFQELYSPQYPYPCGQRQFQKRNKEKTPSAVSTRRSSSDSIELNGKFKTEMCKYYSMRMECPFADMCCFAHGEEQLRLKEGVPVKYKTKPCTKFSFEGYCPYGHRCQFIHTQTTHHKNYQDTLRRISDQPEVFFEFSNPENNPRPRRLSFFALLGEDSQISSTQEGRSLCYERPDYNFDNELKGSRSRFNSI